MKKIICTLLAVVLLFGFSFGCSSRSTDDGTKSGGLIEGTIHQFNMTETDDYLVKNGFTDYVVLMPSEYDTYLMKAKDEFLYFFNQATNIDIRVEYESGTGKTHDAGNKYISIGQTKLLQSANLNINYDQLGDEGCRILTKDKTIYIVGGNSIGTLYSVYDFFQLVFDYECYYYNSFKIDKDVRNVKLYNFDVIDVPDIPHRNTQWGCTQETVSAYRHRFALPMNELIMPVGYKDVVYTGYRWHTLGKLVWEGGQEYKSEWLARNGGNQLCFTARGDKQLYDELVQHVVDNITELSLKKFTPDKYPYMNYITLTIEDTPTVCDCPACGAACEKYGAHTGQVIVFCNDVLAKLKEWMAKPENEAYRRDDLKVMFFAYCGFLDAPVVYNSSTGKYWYKDEGCKMDDDLIVWYAVDSGFGYMKDISVAASDTGRERSQKWFDITDNVAFWTYPIDYVTTMACCDTYNFFTDDFYRYIVEGGTVYFFNEGAYNLKDATAFEALKAFLDYKLMWNASLNSYDLTKEWFSGMFGDAANMMYELFLQERDHNIEFFYNNKKIDTVPTLVPYDGMSDWDTTTLYNWMNICEEALDLIERKYKDGYPEEYARLKYNIELEYISPAYMLFKVFGTQIQGVERAELLPKLQERLKDKKAISSVNEYINGLTV